MKCMFYGAAAFNGDLSSWDVSKVQCVPPLCCLLTCSSRVLLRWRTCAGCSALPPRSTATSVAGTCPRCSACRLSVACPCVLHVFFLGEGHAADVLRCRRVQRRPQLLGRVQGARVPPLSVACPRVLHVFFLGGEHALDVQRCRRVKRRPQLLERVQGAARAASLLPAHLFFLGGEHARDVRRFWIAQQAPLV